MHFTTPKTAKKRHFSISESSCYSPLLFAFESLNALSKADVYVAKDEFDSKLHASTNLAYSDSEKSRLPISRINSDNHSVMQDSKTDLSISVTTDPSIYNSKNTQFSKLNDLNIYYPSNKLAMFTTNLPMPRLAMNTFMLIFLLFTAASTTIGQSFDKGVSIGDKDSDMTLKSNDFLLDMTVGERASFPVLSTKSQLSCSDVAVNNARQVLYVWGLEKGSPQSGEYSLIDTKDLTQGLNSICANEYAQYEYIKLTNGRDVIAASKLGVTISATMTDANYFDTDDLQLSGEVSNAPAESSVNFVAFDEAQRNPLDNITQGVALGSASVAEFNSSGFSLKGKFSIKSKSAKYIYALVEDTKAFAEYRYVIFNKSTLKTNTSQPSDWDFSCANGTTVEIIGYNTGDNDNGGHQGATNDVTIPIPNSGNVYQVVAEVVFKNVDPGSSVQVTAGGQNYDLPEVVVSGSSSSVHVYRGIIPTSVSSVFMAANDAQSLVVYAYRNVASNVVSKGYFTKRSGYNDQTFINYTIPAGTSSRDIILEVPLSEMTNDGRYLELYAEAGGVSDQEIIYGSNTGLPGGNCCLNIVTLTLNNVPASTTSLTLEIDTRHEENGQSVNGQSWVLASAVNIDSECIPPPPSNNPTGCYAIAQSSSGKLFDWQSTGGANIIGTLGRQEVETMSLNYDGSIIYAIDGNEFGTVSKIDGSFQGYGFAVDMNGSMSGSNGSQSASDIDGLAINSNTGLLFATVRKSSNDLLIVIDPGTGKYVPDAFGNNVDYRVMTGALEDIDDIAYNPNDDQIYGISTVSGGGDDDVVVRVNVTTGAVTVVSTLPTCDIEGLTFNDAGELYGTTGYNCTESQRNRLFKIDYSSSNGSVEELLMYSVSDVEAVTCLVSAPDPLPDCANCTVTNTCTFSDAWFGWALPENNCNWDHGNTSYSDVGGASIEYCNDGSARVTTTIRNSDNHCEVWEVCMYLTDPKDWNAWSAAGGEYMDDPDNMHETWTYYILDDSKSFWIGTGSCNKDQVTYMEHRPSNHSKGVQVGYGAGGSSDDFRIRAWFKLNGAINTECGDFSFSGGADCAPPCTGEITSIKIYNQSNDQAVMTVTNGMTINQDDLPDNYYIVAETNNTTESVEILINDVLLNCENELPFTYPGGAQDGNNWNGGIGTYNLIAKAYNVDGCQGEVCDEVNINFSIEEGCDDFSVSAGVDQNICEGETVTLSATVQGETGCDCCIREVSNTDPCGGGSDYVLWLDGESYSANSDLVWEECGDGSARLTGSASGNGQTYEIDILYTGYSTDTPAGSPKDNDCTSTNTSGWFYYTEMSGTLKRGSNTYQLSRRGPAMQVGNNANQTASGYGASGWFEATKGSTVLNGDINIMLTQTCSSSAGCSPGSYSGWMYLGSYGNSHYYKKTAGDVTYAEAKSAVQALGGKLPKIETAGENQWIASVNDGSIWLGATDVASEGNFKWNDGSNLSYSNWASGEPNNYGSGEDYVHMYSNGTWNDQDDENYNWVVMEVECGSGGSGGISSDVSYLWTPGNYTTPSITVEPTSTTTYTVSVTGCDGCTASDQVTVNVNGSFECPADVTIECDESSDPSNTGEPTLDCDADAVITYDDEISGSCPVTITRTWTASVTRTVDDPCIPHELAHWNFANAYTLGCSRDKQPLDVGLPPSSTDDSQCNSMIVSETTNDDGSSCVKGAFGSSEAAICVSVSPESTFKNTDDDAITFTVAFGANDEGKLSGISFYERVVKNNENFGYVDYARKYGIRILKNGVEIYKTVDQPTTFGSWTHHSYDFTGADFSYSGTTAFKFEILGYDPTSKGYNKEVWEFDELKIFGCCGTETSNETQEFTCTQTITIQDTENPTITNVPSDVTYTCADEVPAFDISSVTASDNCAFTTDTMSVVTGDIPCDYTITRTWTVTDDCGNTDSESQVITIKDDVDPTMCDPDSYTFECEGSVINKQEADKWNNDNINQLENCAEDNCTSVTITSNYNFNDIVLGCGETGVITVTYTATDECGNSTSKDATFTIVDTTNPTVSCDPANDTKECEGVVGNEALADAWNDSNIALLESCSSDECGDITVVSNYDFDNLSDDCGETGSITVIYTIEDECENKTTKEATFTIVDTNGPTIVTPADSDARVECDGSGIL